MTTETDIVVEYLDRLLENHATGVKETSNYPALAHLFNTIGKKLQVRCIIHPRGKGAGIPDGGFFTTSQLKIAITDEDRMLTQTPERGAIEVKGTSDDVLATANNDQVAKYTRAEKRVGIEDGTSPVYVHRVPFVYRGGEHARSSFSMGHSDG